MTSFSKENDLESVRMNGREKKEKIKRKGERERERERKRERERETEREREERERAERESERERSINIYSRVLVVVHISCCSDSCEMFQSFSRVCHFNFKKRLGRFKSGCVVLYLLLDSRRPMPFKLQLSYKNY